MVKLAIIGIGKMGNAILKGITKKKLYEKEELLLVVHSEEQKAKLSRRGFIATCDVKEAFENAKIILLAIKPQKFSEALSEVNQYDFEGKGIISIAAGVSISNIEKMFKHALVVRAMPNLSAAIGQSVTTLCSKDETTAFYKQSYKIFKAIGSVVKIKEEEMDYTIPLNGSMPAYIYYFVKSFIDAAVSNGIDEETAKELVIDTIMSSLKMLKSSKKDISILIDNVCSKGGTTIAGLNKLKEARTDMAIKDCYQACKNRSVELSEVK